MSEKFEISPFGRTVWEDRYALKDEYGNIIEKDIIETFRRVAKTIASKEKNPVYWEEKFYNIMINRYFCPAGRILAHSGTHYSQLLNCFVLPFEDDSLESIMETAKNMAITQKLGGGTGFNYSTLRPAAARIKGVNGRSCGVLGFIHMMSTVSEVIEQGGCFIADTYVATSIGPKKIKDLKHCDKVFSWDGSSFVLRECSDSWLTRKQAPVWKISTDSKLEIFATENHPFMPQEGFDPIRKNYVKVKDLSEGLALMPFSSKSIKITSNKESHVEDVWNVEVSGTHNFVVCDEKMSVGVVVSNSRRGANMGLLEIWHPDVWEFISYKTEHNWDRLKDFMEVKDEEKWAAFKFENTYKLQMYNVSIGITDEFLAAVKNNSDWSLKWKDEEWLLYKVKFKKHISEGTYKEQSFEVTANNNKAAIWKVKKKIPFPSGKDIFEVVSKRKIKASEIWNKICYNAWADGCPGIINFTTARKYHNLEYISPLVATNPCLHGDTLVAVADGREAVSIRQLSEEGKDVPVYCRDNKGETVIRFMRNPRITGYNEDIYIILLDDGNNIKATKNHKLLFLDGYVPVSEYKRGDCLYAIYEDTKECLNKKIYSIEYDGKDNVYNGTVDDFHNFYIFLIDKNGRRYLTNSKNCGEQFLSGGSSCNLSSNILSSFVKDGKFDYSEFKETIHTEVRFADNVIDVCQFPIPSIQETALKERRVGIGTMAVHDLLIELKLGYDTEEGRAVLDKVLEIMRDEAYRASIELAKEKGSFPLFDREKYLQSAYIKTLPEDIQEGIKKYGIRNSLLLSQAPSGTISTLYNASTGCEPWFSMSFQRNTRLGSFEDGCPAYIKWRKEHPNEEKPSYFKTAQEISPEDHIKMLILFSKYIDSSVSKTLNLANSATVEDISKAFFMAMENNVKGITVFRDGSKSGVFINKDKKDEVIEEAKKYFNELQNIKEDDSNGDSRVAPKKRGNETFGSTTRVHMQNHNLYVTVNQNDKKEFVEVFATVGEDKKTNTRHTSGVEDSWAEGLAKIISLALRAGVQMNSIIRNLKNIPSDKPVFSTIGSCESSELISSPPHAIARVMEEALKRHEDNKKLDIIEGEACKECGSTRTKKGATCSVCIDCGYSGC